MADVDFHVDAWDEYQEAIRWYRKRSQRAAQGLVEEVSRVIQRIVDSPQSFPKADNLRRFALLRRYPFRIIYEVVETGIFVVAVAHGSREADYWRHRTDSP